MADFHYVCTPVIGNVYRACRGAVLWPLLRKQGGEQTADRIARVLQRWRIRAAVLSQHGWHCAQGKDLQYVRNCPPFGIRLTNDSVFAVRCKRGRICPWCYSKTVVATAYEAVERTIYRGGKKPNPDLWLYATQRSWSWPIGRVSAKDVFEAAKDSRRDDVEMANSIGAFTLVRVAPSHGDIELTRSTIMVLRNDEEPDPPDDPDVKILRTIKKKSMADLVGWACRYPVGLMYGNPQLTLEILDEARRRRFRSHFRTGALYWDGVWKGMANVQD